jgi:hypothetical protein
MTRSSERQVRRKLGRPPQTNDTDQLTIDLVAAMQDAWGISERKAIDLAICFLEAQPGPPTKVPRGQHAADGLLVGYEQRTLKTFAGRSATLRQKAKPRPQVVRVLSLALRCRDVGAVHQLFSQLAILGAVASETRLQQVIARLEERVLPAGHI